LVKVHTCQVWAFLLLILPVTMKFELQILGSSSAIPAYGRGLTSQVLNINERIFLIDCGDGTQLHIRKYNVRFQRIRHIFISHLHGDHFFGLIGLLSSMHLLGRTAGITIHGPARIRDIIEYQFRITETVCNYPIVFNPLVEGGHYQIIDDHGYTVDTFPLVHRIPTWGFVFREKELPLNIKKSFIEQYKPPIEALVTVKMGEDYVDTSGNVIPNHTITKQPAAPRSFAFCSDTAYNEGLIGAIQGVDLLYHEATFAEDKRREADNKFHSTAKDAAKIAKLANVKQLVIGHFSARYKNLQVLLDEAREIFPNTVLANDGMIIGVERKTGC